METLNQLFDGELLSPILQKVRFLQGLQLIVNQQLSVELQTHCCVANYAGGCLSLAVDSGAWATPLRYAIPDLLERLRSLPEFTTLQNIRCLVEPSLFKNG